MAKRRTNLERMASQAKEWKLACEVKIHALEAQLVDANAEFERACTVVDQLHPELFREPAAETTATVDPAPIDPPVDELADSGLADFTVEKLRRLKMTNAQAVHDAVDGDVSKLLDMVDEGDERFGPKEITAIRRWVEKNV